LQREISSVISTAIALKVHRGRILYWVRNICTIAHRIGAGKRMVDR